MALLVVNAAGVGVILSGFLSFYAFVAMASLYADGAAVAGFAVEGRAPSGEPDGDDPET